MDKEINYGPLYGAFDYSFEETNSRKWYHLAGEMLIALALVPAVLALEIKEKVIESRKAQAGELEKEIGEWLSLLK